MNAPWSQNPHLIKITDVREGIIVDLEIKGGEEVKNLEDNIEALEGQYFEGGLIGSSTAEVKKIDDERGGISAGAIVGISIGMVVVLALFLIFLKMRYAKGIEEEKNLVNHESTQELKGKNEYL